MKRAARQQSFESANAWRKRWYQSESKRLGRNPMDVIRQHRKNFVVKLLGGCCQFCGYKRTLRNLVFHHLYGKESGLSARYFQYRLEYLLSELKKCVLCCHNCHGEIHEGLIKQSVIQKHHRNTKRRLDSLRGYTWQDFALNWKNSRLIKKPQLTKVA